MANTGLAKMQTLIASREAIREWMLTHPKVCYFPGLQLRVLLA